MKSTILSLPLVGPYVNHMVRNIDLWGVKGAIQKEIKRSGTKFEIKGLTEETERILKNKGVIISCNHSHEIETYAILVSLPSRKDYFMITTASLVGISPLLDKNLIPVYVRHHYKDLHPNFTRKLSGLILETFHSSPDLSPEEEHLKNIESINNASKKVKNAGSVIIFPSPHRTKEKRDQWYPGIGWLIKRSGPLKDSYYVKAYVANSSRLDYLRLFPKMGTILPEIKVYFGKPQKLSDIFEDDAKKLTKKLENQYNSWQKTLVR